MVLREIYSSNSVHIKKQEHSRNKANWDLEKKDFPAGNQSFQVFESVIETQSFKI